MIQHLGPGEISSAPHCRAWAIAGVEVELPIDVVEMLLVVPHGMNSPV
jgi:hypothetical protein